MSLILSLSNDGSLEVQASQGDYTGPSLRLSPNPVQAIKQLQVMLAAQRSTSTNKGLGTPASPTQAMLDHLNDTRWAEVAHLIKRVEPKVPPKRQASPTMTLEDLGL